MTKQEMVDLFRQKAELVSAKVIPVTSMKDAYAYAIDMCTNKEACQLLISGCGEAISETAGALCEAKPAPRIIAAPQLKDKELRSFSKLAEERGIQVIAEGMRTHLAGIDMAFTSCEFGIAETGTIVIDSASEELRLATMIGEIHIAVLKVSDIVKASYDIESKLDKRMKKAPSYMAFITGPSRTADIERVLAIGVHGPLELHILLLED
ncbi:LutC/YkgG family protein [Megalodesulfovibrio paquesii]